MSRLDEILVRLKAATPKWKFLRVVDPVLIGAWCVVVADDKGEPPGEAEANLWLHAPTDLDWLAGLVRACCDDVCESLETFGARCIDSSRDVPFWCWTCRMRHYVNQEEG